MVAKSKKPKAQVYTPSKSDLLFKVGKDVPKWYALEISSPSKSLNEKYDKQKCEQIYQAECDLYQKFYQQDQSSDYQWLQTSLSTTSKVKFSFLKKRTAYLIFHLGSSCCFSYINSSFANSYNKRTRKFS